MVLPVKFIATMVQILLELTKRLSQLLQSNKTQEILHNWSSNKGISWHFPPSCAPHFGGLWESAVKAMKMILKKVVGKQILRNDEFLTLLYEAAAILHSRPLAPLDSLPPDGVSPLMPGHFTIGGPCLQSLLSHFESHMVRGGNYCST